MASSIIVGEEIIYKEMILSEVKLTDLFINFMHTFMKTVFLE
jgi:hypothetical protein